MNWNAVIKSLQEEINACATRLKSQSTFLSEEGMFQRQADITTMQVYIVFAKALAEGLKEEARDKTFDDHPLEYN